MKCRHCGETEDQHCPECGACYPENCDYCNQSSEDD